MQKIIANSLNARRNNAEFALNTFFNINKHTKTQTFIFGTNTFNIDKYLHFNNQTHTLTCKFPHRQKITYTLSILISNMVNVLTNLHID